MSDPLPTPTDLPGADLPTAATSTRRQPLPGPPRLPLDVAEIFETSLSDEPAWLHRGVATLLVREARRLEKREHRTGARQYYLEAARRYLEAGDNAVAGRQLLSAAVLFADTKLGRQVRRLAYELLLDGRATMPVI